MRQQLLGLLKTERRVAALLHAISRDGRLATPGLAPPIRGPIVNSEANEVTPVREVARLMAVKREGEWGSSPVCGLV